MTDNERYGVGQRLAFLALGLGFAACAVSGATPFWVTGEWSVNDITKIFGESIPFIGKITLLKYTGGLFFYCVEAPLVDSQKCEMYSLDKGNAREKLAVIALLVGLLVSFLSLLAACCRMCCCHGGRTIGHGISTFVAGGLFLTTVICFAVNDAESWGHKLDAYEYGWAFYIFLSGTILTLLASFTLCCAYPQSPIRGMVFNHLPQTLVVTSSSYGRLQEDVHPLSAPNPVAPGPMTYYPEPSVNPVMTGPAK